MLKKLLYSFGFTLSALSGMQAQTTLFTETFDGASHAFTLNTSDQSATAGTSGSNYWIVNNSYMGGNGSLFCLGFPFSFTVAATTSQPVAITNSPNSKYLHIVSAAAVSSGISNASFTAADGFCNFDENNFSKMTNDVSTIGLDSVEVSFYWLCSGGTESYGEVYYSTNAGSTWTLVSVPTSQYSNQASWAQRKLTLPAFAQKSTLRFGFRFVNLTTSAASDPSFSVDDVNIRGFVAGPVNSIAAATFTGTAFCPGDAMTINFAATGTYNSGNVFTAQLSNAAGSFVAPTAIGQISSQTAAPISATLPLGTAVGTGYRIRVVSSNLATTGANNGTNITVAAGPTAGVASIGSDSICSGTNTTVTLTGVVGSAVWESSSNGTSFVASSFIGNSFNTGNLTQSVYLRAIVINSCGSDTSNAAYVVVLPTPTALFTAAQGSAFDVTFSNNSSGTFNNINWNFGDGDSSNNNAPTHTYSSTGGYNVSLTVSNQFGCSSTYTDSIDVIAVAVELLKSENFGSFNCFPNPSNGNFQIEMTLNQSQDIQINIIDLNGRRLANLHKGFLTAGTAQFSAALELPAGIYVLEVQGEKGRAYQKIVIE